MRSQRATPSRGPTAGRQASHGTLLLVSTLLALSFLTVSTTASRIFLADGRVLSPEAAAATFRNQRTTRSLSAAGSTTAHLYVMHVGPEIRGWSDLQEGCADAGVQTRLLHYLPYDAFAVRARLTAAVNGSDAATEGADDDEGAAEEGSEVLRRISGVPGVTHAYPMPASFKLSASVMRFQQPLPRQGTDRLAESGNTPVVIIAQGSEVASVPLMSGQLRGSNMTLAGGEGGAAVSLVALAAPALSSASGAQLRLTQRAAEGVAKEVVAALGSNVSAAGDGVRVTDVSATQRLYQVAGLTILVDAASPQIMRLTVPADIVSLLLKSLSNSDDVIFVEQQPDVTLLNVDTQWAVQSGERGQRPLWDAGLRGQGEVVGVSDTGLDATHCAFYDPDQPVAYSDRTPSTNMDHRKVVTYVPLADRLTTAADHGTHVAGTVAGNIPDSSHPLAQDAGLAPEAKLAIVDLENAHTGVLNVPTDIGSAVFRFIYDEAGARVISNSWGAAVSQYSAYDLYGDTFVFSNPDAVVLFAAGNAGVCGDHTLATPGLMKNAITVGATRNDLRAAQRNCEAGVRAGVDTCELRASGFQPERSDIDTVINFSSRGPAPDYRLKPDVVAAGHPVMSYASRDTARGGSSTEPHCGRGECSMGDALQRRCSADDGVAAMSGTSMATPAVAGGAALVRQYFREGWYPTGSRSAGDALTPTAATVKAVLINGAVDLGAQGGELQDQENRYHSLPAAPSVKQGYGRAELDNSLHLADVGGSPRLYVSQDRAVSAGDTVRFCFANNSPGTRLSITLVWTDPPPSATAALALVNNLDLAVRTPAGQWVLGNGYDSGYARLMHGGGTNFVADTTNNVEKVVLDDAAQGTYVAYVTGVNVPMGEQRFSLVATGDAGVLDAQCPDAGSAAMTQCPNDCRGEQGSCEQGTGRNAEGSEVTVPRCVCASDYRGADCSATHCPNNCLGRGRCEDGQCVCTQRYQGPWCQHEVALAEWDEQVSMTSLPPHQLHASAAIEPNARRVVVNIAFFQQTNAAVFVRLGEPPTLSPGVTGQVSFQAQRAVTYNVFMNDYPGPGRGVERVYVTVVGAAAQDATRCGVDVAVRVSNEGLVLSSGLRLLVSSMMPVLVLLATLAMWQGRV